MPQTEKSLLLSAALDYARRGWEVLPLHSVKGTNCSCRKAKCSSPGKHPRTRHGLKEATRDEQTIKRWWRTWPYANVGICTGSRSGFVVVDVDRRHGGEESLRELEQQYGKLPHTVMSRTGGGGQHLLFAHPGGTVRNKVQVGGLPGLDVRGDGGYIVAPPSLHTSGRPYQWEPGCDPEHGSLAPLPQWLQDLLQVLTRKSKPVRSTAGWRKLVAEGAVEGSRNQTVASLAGFLLHRGVDFMITLELLQAWNEARNLPPLAPEEVTQVVESIAGLEERSRQDKSENT